MKLEASLEDRLEVSLGQRGGKNGNFLFLTTDDESVFLALTKNYLVLFA